MSPEGRGSGGAEKGDGSSGGSAESGAPPRRRIHVGRILRRMGRGVAVTLGALVLLLALALFTLTQTDPGRGWVASFIEGRLEGAVRGDVRLGPILAGNLLTRAVLGEFTIVGPDGETFVSLDTVRVEYDPTGFLRGDFSFRSLEAARARLQLLQDEEGVWNFEEIFRPEDPDAPPGETRVVLSDARVADGRITVRQPYAAGLDGAARERAIQEAVRGETVWNVERTEEGWRQTYELAGLEGRFPLLRLVHPRLPMEVRMEDVSGRLEAVRQPLSLTRFDGSLVFRDTIRVAMDRVRLAESELAGSGWVVPEDPPVFRFEMEADPVAFAELQWLPVPVPEEGGGPVEELVLRSRGEITVVEARGGDVRVRDTHITGSFVLALEDPARFEAMDLAFHPLRIQLVDRLLERPERIDGYLEGSVTGSGPIDLMRLEGEVSFRDMEGGETPSRLELEGELGIVEPFRMRELRLGFEAFEPRWVRLLGFRAELAGRVEGEATLSGVPGGRLAFETDLTHRPGEGAASHVVGAGSLTLGGADAAPETSEVDVELAADPLSLALLDPYFPNLELVGTVRGPISARGTLADLQARADLETPRGRLTFDGRFDLAADRKRYDAEVTARDVDLHQWAGKLPETRLAVRGRVDGAGTDPATLEARLDLEILPSVVAEARADTSLLRFHVSEGLATVDTFEVRSDVGRVAGRGGFGLAEDRSGSLILDLEVPALSSWNRWLVEGRSGAGPAEPPEDLFADFPGPAGPAGEDPEGRGSPADTLAGTLTARGVVYGNIRAFSLGGRLEAASLHYDGYEADSLVARLDVGEPLSLDSLVLNATAREVRALGYRLDSIAVRLEDAGAGPADLRLAAAADTGLAIEARTAVEWTASRKTVAFERLDLRLGRQALSLSGPAEVVYGDSGLVVRDFDLVGDQGGRLRADGRIPDAGAADFRLAFQDLRLREFLRPHPGAPEAGGRMDGSVSVSGTASAPRIEGEFRVLRPSFGSVSYPLLTGDFRYRDRVLEGSTALLGDADPLVRVEGSVRADLSFRRVEDRVPEDAFDFRVVADSMPLGVVELGVESLRDIRGTVRGRVDVGGGPEGLRLDGEARLTGGEAAVPALGVRFREVTGGVSFGGSEARLDSLRLVSSAGGRGLVTGTVGLSSPTDPSLDLEITAVGLRAVDRRAYGFDLEGSAHLGGSYRQPVLEGDLRVYDGTVRQEELLRSREIVDLTDPDVYALIDTTITAERRLLEEVQNPFMRNLRLDVTLDVGPDLWLRSEILDVELAGEDLEVRMDRAENRMVLFGTVRLVRGTYVFRRLQPYRQQLRIVGGTIEFVGTPGLNPNLQITAQYRTRTEQGPVTITAVITGTMQNTQLALSSDPPLSESDQLCFLAVGSPCFAAVDQRFAERLVRESLLGSISTGLTGAFVGDVGLDYLSLRSTAPAGATAESEGLLSQGLFAHTELEIGKYLGNDLFVTVTQPLGSRYPGWSIEWRFTENWTLEARAENRFQRIFGTAAGTSLEADQTFGVFLFREWSF